MNLSEKKGRGYVGLILATQSGDLIVQHRDDEPNILWPDSLSVFGGSIEENETLGEAVIREVVDEETNLKITLQDISPFGFYPEIPEKHGSDFPCYIFLLNTPVDPETLEVYEGQGFQILPRNTDLRTIKARPIMLEIFHDYFQKTDPSQQ